MFIDVANPETHRLYARALAKTGKHLSAIYEYNSAIAAGAPTDMAIEVYHELAKGYDKLGEKQMAEKARELEAKMKAKPKKRPSAK